LLNIQSDLFQLGQPDEHLLKNHFIVWPTYRSYHITQVASFGSVANFIFCRSL